MNTDRERASLELTRRNPFWVCLLVFALLAADYGFRLTRSVEQRRQLGQAEQVQERNIERMSSALAQLPRVEAKLQALSFDLLQVAKTNATAAQIVREFNIQWNPGAETFVRPVSAPTGIPTLATPTQTTNAPIKK